MSPDPHPIRLFVTDDLRRSRVTVLFRLLLALPLLVWVLLWANAAFLVGFVMWLAVLFERRAPDSLHGFVASFVRYSTHVSAYVTLAADPYPWFTPRETYPVDLEIDPPSVQSRWSAGFRLLLALPALLLAGVLGTVNVLSYSGGAAATAAFLAWFAALVRGRMPRGLRDLIAYAAGYTAQAYGYCLLLTGRYPSSDPDRLLPDATLPGHAVRVAVTDELRRSRLLVFFRLPLTIPHVVWFLLWSVPAFFAAVAGWLYALATGRLPAPLHRFLAAYVRYAAHWYGFATVVGRPFPGFAGRQGSYPVDLEINPPERQSRWGVAFRLVLALPALLLSGAYGGVLVVVAVLGWFAALVVGRMPEGLRNLGAACLRYNAQAHAYLLLVTPRYPYASPVLHGLPGDEQLLLPLEDTAEAAT